MSKMKLTKWGEFVRMYSVMTAPDWWAKVKKEIDRAADEDSEWELLIDERIRGLQELKERYYELSN